MNPYLEDFPILGEKNGRRVAYLDNAATTQKPLPVLAAIENYYREENANPYRGLYDLSVRATQANENARIRVQKFINAARPEEIIFTRNATEALNLVAYSYALRFLRAGDEIVLPVSEHHSNLLPWQQAAARTGAKLVYLYPDENGMYADSELEEKIGPRTKIVAAACVSNVLGTVLPVEKMIRLAHQNGAVAVLDCAQSVPHFKLDVQALDADFAAFSGHKMLGPMGIGVLYGKKEWLEKMPPFLFGGEMIEYVTEQESTFAPLPHKFEAGTPNVEGAVGLEAAIAYLDKVGYEAIAKTERELLDYTLAGLAEIPHVKVYGDHGKPCCGVISFNVEEVHPHDVASILDGDGVAIRAGHHCAQPLMRYLGVNATCRASFYFYNTKDDADRFLAALKKVRGFLGYGA